jgi:hypothetical protein
MASCAAVQESLHAWQKLNSEDVPAANKVIENAHLAALPVAPPRPDLSCRH